MTSLSEDDLENEELYGIRNSTLFIIDATPPMFQNNPQEGIPYFLQCIRLYKDFLKQKLVWNKQDWIGLMLFGTDMHSKTKHISMLQKLNLVSKKNLQEVIEIDEGKKWESYRNTASSTVYPLHDALWTAARAFSDKNITMPIRKAILFTCLDNPPMTDNNEKYRIRVKAANYSDINLQLFVVGLSENWNHDLFYKDLELLSRKIDVDDYKRICLKELVEQVKLPSRNMAKLPWRLGENVNIDVSLRNLAVKTQYLKEEKISKETSTPLMSRAYLTLANNNDNKETGEDTENEHASSPVLEMDIQKYQTFGRRNINFTSAEVRSLSKMGEPGIDLICVKPISYHPLYHFDTPYFVIPNKSNRKDNKLLFSALLDKCDSKNLMVICAVTIRKHSSPKLCTMIPNAQNGGFYLYKIPFRENTRNLSEYLSEHIYDNKEKKLPFNPNGIKLLKKIIEKLSIEYNPKLFSNPKLQVQIEAIETLALDSEKPEDKVDDTIPKVDEMRKVVNNLLDEYDEIFKEEIDNVSDVPPKKKIKRVNKEAEPAVLGDEAKIRELVKKGKIETSTVSELRTILRTLCLKTSGKKDELINRVKEHYK
ncbi:PREDICTED: X-ray repair cross-complementing protein 6-like [Habropoda laboriosa]|uniref:X-ray repair cross-complementing protein 6-like n=1 Tax=Habropoda laboriosa TaxID=597456 RepID=UPI00083DE39A|nr:PREDICTED: X-ray repair cross-complementing protein 6-like [Habropoda laboriosa]